MRTGIRADNSRVMTTTGHAAQVRVEIGAFPVSFQDNMMAITSKRHRALAVLLDGSERR